MGKKETYKYLREKREVTQQAKDNLKKFTRMKNSILNALRQSDMTIDQLARVLNTPKNEVLFYLMSMVRYGLVRTGPIDDMDEYFSYKIQK